MTISTPTLWDNSFCILRTYPLDGRLKSWKLRKIVFLTFESPKIPQITFWDYFTNFYPISEFFSPIDREFLSGLDAPSTISGLFFVIEVLIVTSPYTIKIFRYRKVFSPIL